jgi:hypothetical protein
MPHRVCARTASAASTGAAVAKLTKTYGVSGLLRRTDTTWPNVSKYVWISGTLMGPFTGHTYSE